METQDIMNTETGTKESTTLKPATVKIESVGVREVEKYGKKLSCTVKHPDKDERLEISEVKFEKGGKLRTSGLWINLDDDNKIVKGSALAVFLGHALAKTPKELVGKEIDTVESEKGFLCFKGY